MLISLCVRPGQHVTHGGRVALVWPADPLPDELRVGTDTQDETSTAQLTTGDIALTGGESAAGDTADGLTMSAEEALQTRGDTTWTARHADEVMDPPGPPSAS